MDMICSLTGKSPATTGFGSEGALTKAPFNMMLPGDRREQRAGVGNPGGATQFHHGHRVHRRNHRVDHDSSILVPELWCRMRVAERDPRFLIENGYLEKLDDFEFEGREVLASRLGYRITASFVDRFLGRIFEMPGSVFPLEMLRPEKQNLADFAEGVNAIVDAQRAVANDYFEDGSIEAACPPIKAILHIMAFGEYEGKRTNDPEIRAMFTREYLLASDWYRERLHTQQALDTALWTKHRDAVEAFTAGGLPATHIDLQARLAATLEHLRYVKSEDYPRALVEPQSEQILRLQIRRLQIRRLQIRRLQIRSHGRSLYNTSEHEDGMGNLRGCDHCHSGGHLGLFPI